MAIRWTDWTTTQRARLNHVRKMRLGRQVDPLAPLALDGFNVPASPTPQWLAFLAALPRPRDANAWRDRVLEWVAANAAHTGVIHVERALFGRVVLSRAWDPVGRALGEQVYDALLASGLCAVTGDGTGGASVTAPVPSPVTAQVTAQREARGEVGRPRASAGTGASRPRARGHVREAAAGSEVPFRAVTGDAPDQTGRRIYSPDTQPLAAASATNDRTANDVSRGRLSSVADHGTVEQELADTASALWDASVFVLRRDLAPALSTLRAAACYDDPASIASTAARLLDVAPRLRDAAWWGSVRAVAALLAETAREGAPCP